MRLSADPLGGNDSLGTWLTNHVLDLLFLKILLPQIASSIKALSFKIKSMPTIRIEFPSDDYRVFFVNFPQGGFIQLKKQFGLLGGQLTRPTPIAPINQTEKSDLQWMQIRTKVHNKEEENLLKEIIEHQGAKIIKVVREAKSKLPRLQLIQF